MCTIINLLIENASLVLSAVVAIATIAYTWINYLMYKESKNTRLQKMKPEVVPYLQSTASKKVLCLYEPTEKVEIVKLINI